MLHWFANLIIPIHNLCLSKDMKNKHRSNLQQYGLLKKLGIHYLERAKERGLS
jgi:hypothetical protein